MFRPPDPVNDSKSRAPVLFYSGITFTALVRVLQRFFFSSSFFLFPLPPPRRRFIIVRRRGSPIRVHANVTGFYRAKIKKKKNRLYITYSGPTTSEGNFLFSIILLCFSLFFYFSRLCETSKILRPNTPSTSTAISYSTPAVRALPYIECKKVKKKKSY